MNGNNALANFQHGMMLGDQVRQRRDEREYRSALDVLATNPEDADARATVYRHDPRTAIAIGQDADRRAFNADLANYVSSQPNALTNVLLGVRSSPPAGSMNASNQPNALTPVQPGTSFGEAFAPLAQPAQQQSEPLGDDADLSFLGEPQTARDAAWMKLLRRDPIRALKVQSELRDTFVDRVKAESDFYSLAVAELTRMKDDAGWQAGLQRLVPMAEALGHDLMLFIPPVYPGPEAVQQLLEGALPTKERLDLFLRTANVEADNARQDRNTDSMISTREERLRETSRVNNARLANQRRGQDLNDKRQRDRPAPRSAPPRQRASDDLPLMNSPAEARALPKGTRFRTPDGKVKVVP